MSRTCSARQSSRDRFPSASMQKLANTSRPPGFSSRARRKQNRLPIGSAWARNARSSAGAAPTACTWSASVAGSRLSQCIAVAEKAERQRAVGENLPVEAGRRGADEHAGQCRRGRAPACPAAARASGGTGSRNRCAGDRCRRARSGAAGRAGGAPRSAAHHLHRGAAVGRAEIGDAEGRAPTPRVLRGGPLDDEIGDPC